MTTQISGTTGVSQVQAGSINQDDLAANVVGKGPAFSVYRSAAQAIGSAVYTKVQFDSKAFDTNSSFDSVANYRFQPNVAGYYQINAVANFGNVATGVFAVIYKNGVAYSTGNQPGADSNSNVATANALISLNGTTDYLEMFVFTISAQNLNGGLAFTQFSGFLVRAA